MFYSIRRRCWLALPVFLLVLGSIDGVYARPAAVFIPHLDYIQSNLPSGLAMRLPTQIPLSGPSDIDETKLIVRVFPSETPQSFTLSLFTCDRSPHPCLLGSFSVDPKTTASTQRELERHKRIGDHISLTTTIGGYLIEGPLQNPSHSFSTMMWEQNDMIYTISFPAIERENIIAMAVSMAREQPLYREVLGLTPSP